LLSSEGTKFGINQKELVSTLDRYAIYDSNTAAKPYAAHITENTNRPKRE